MPGSTITFAVNLTVSTGGSLPDVEGLTYYLQQNGGAPYVFSIVGRENGGSAFNDEAWSNAEVTASPGNQLAPVNARDLGALADNAMGGGTYFVANITLRIADNAPAGTYTIQSTGPDACQPGDCRQSSVFSGFASGGKPFPVQPGTITVTVGSASTPTPTATPTPSETPTPTPNPTATVTPNPSASPTPGGSPNPPGPNQLLNISTRLRVLTQDNALIGGFILTGTEKKKVILRALGPSLANDGVQGALANPTIELYGSEGLIFANDNWKDSQREEIEASTIPPGNDLEAAIVATLDANNAAYTAVVRGRNDTTGIGLIEVYDLATGAKARLANISSRGFVDTGENVLIGGFIIGGGDQPARVVVRALGPSLGASGVGSALADPTLQLVNANGQIVRENDDWKQSQRAELEAMQIAPSNDLESALVANLPGGNYTAIVRGKNDGIGVGLVEVYNVQ